MFIIILTIAPDFLSYCHYCCLLTNTLSTNLYKNLQYLFTNLLSLLFVNKMRSTKSQYENHINNWRWYG